MNIKLLFSTMMFSIVSQLYGQGNYQWINKEDSVKIYQGGEKFPVKTFRQEFKVGKPRNIILMIGDGMGVSHVFAYGPGADQFKGFMENTDIAKKIISLLGL